MNDIYSISNLINYLKLKIDTDINLKKIKVQGEISNLSYASSGHIYFSLKDNRAKVSCVYFRFNQKKDNHTFKNGDMVIVNGDVSVYEGSGNFQLYIKNIELSGKGNLYLEFELLKNKLFKEGLFDVKYKKNKPEYPLKIAVLVGKDSAAESDIRSCFKRRWPIAEVDYYYVLVQGDNSSKNICEKLIEVDEKKYDAIILSRGGGSIEDLWSFNDINLAYCIFNLKTFIITGIGHEQDFTIADFVADTRASTPTAAVELLTPDIESLLLDLKNLKSKIKSSLIIKFNDYKLKYFNCQKILDTHKNYLYTFKNKIKELNYVRCKNINNLINNYKRKVDTNRKILYILLNKKINFYKSKNQYYFELLKTSNPLHILEKGFVIAYSNNEILKSVKQIKPNSNVKIKLKDGELDLIVKEVKIEN